MLNLSHAFPFFFLYDTATTEIYTFPTRRSSDLTSLHAAAAFLAGLSNFAWRPEYASAFFMLCLYSVPLFLIDLHLEDRKSTRLNSSHPSISYAVFCLKKKK